MEFKQVKTVPSLIQFSYTGEPVKLEAAEGEGAKLRRFNMVAYTGGKMQLAGWFYPVVVDLAGLSGTRKSRPILKDHDAGQIVGHTDTVDNDGRMLRVAGVVSGGGAAASEVVTSSDNGFPWQASIGARATRVVFVGEGKKASANGQEFVGPFYMVRKSMLGEVSFVALGADDDTSAKVAAGSRQNKVKGNSMNENETVNVAPDSERAAATRIGRMAARAGDAGAAILAKYEAGEIDGLSAMAELADLAERQAELADLRNGRPKPPGITGVASSSGVSTQAVIECALASGLGLKDIDKHYKPEVCERADARYRNGLTLGSAIVEAANANGFRCHNLREDHRGALRAAHDSHIHAAGSFSSADIGGIVSGVAGKFAVQGFLATEQSWREVARRNPVNDFKTATGYRLVTGLKFEPVGSDGELKHGELGEAAYSNKADTRGLIISITRQDQRNDDAGCLTEIPLALGRGAGLALNQVFWTAFLNNAAFFTEAHGNYLSGATTALSIDCLNDAVEMFLDQTDEKGEPLGLAPAILLTANANKARAEQIYKSVEITNPAAQSATPTVNPHAGLYKPVSSAYLGNANYAGSSKKAWYLLANPAEVAAIEVCFLDGREQPIIEAGQTDFSLLGMQLRGYFDFGVALQEYRAGVKIKGEA